jgi:hypothetical protein
MKKWQQDEQNHPIIFVLRDLISLLCIIKYEEPFQFPKMKNANISFQEGQIVLAHNKIAEIKEVREKTLLLEMAKTKEITELSKGKVDVVTFGTEFF